MSLYRRPNSPYWWSKLTLDGNVVRFSTGERTKVKALRAEVARLEKATLERAGADGRYTFATLATKFLEWKETHRDGARDRSPETIRMMEKHVKAIGAHFGAGRDPRTISAEALSEYKQLRLHAVGAGTVCKELSTLRQVLRFAAEVAKIIPSPAPTVRNPEHHYTGERWQIASEAQLAALLAALAVSPNREVYPWALLRANTGLRPTEATRLRWESIDLVAGQIRVEAAIAKTRRLRAVDLNAGALDALWIMALRRGPGPAIGRVFAFDQHYGAWRTARDVAGLPGFRPHDLRHTLASRLHADGQPLPVIRDILGHLTLDMANRYAHTFSHDRAEALGAVAVPSVPASVPLGGAGRAFAAPKGTSVGAARRGGNGKDSSS